MSEAKQLRIVDHHWLFEGEKPVAAVSLLGYVHLFAAAPDLLEALIKIVKYADSEPDGGDTVAMHRANVERARAAIAKATGAA